MHAHQTPIKLENNNPIKVKKQKDICCKHRTRSWRRRNNLEKIAATNVLYLAKLAPSNADFEQHEHEFTIDDL